MCTHWDDSDLIAVWDAHGIDSDCIMAAIASLCRCTWAWQRLYRCVDAHGHGSDCTMYEKKTDDEALKAGSWNLFQKSQHPDPKFSWLEACHIAEQGIQP